jgi:type IV secretion system protein VirD4
VLLAWGIGAGLLLALKLPLSTATPLTAIQYAYHYHNELLVQQGFIIVFSVLGTLVIGVVALVLYKKRPELHGSAAWATSREITKVGLFAAKGIVLGKKNGKYIRMDGDTFAMVAAPTRSGKGVGIVIPNLLSWDGSAVVLDIKSENFFLTSGYRQAHGQLVYAFNPAPSDYKTHRYNPLHYISDDPNKRIDDIQKITSYLIPTPPGVDPMWSSEGRDLLFGVILAIVCIDELPNTFSEVLRQLKTDTTTAEHLSELLEKHKKVLPDVCIHSLNNFITKAGKEQSGVKSTITSALNIFSNPLIEAATSGNDFDFRDLRRQKMTIYICIQPNDLDRLAPLINLFVQQLIDQNTQDMPAHYENKRLVRGNPDYKYPVLLLLDEFTSIGRLPILEKSIAFIAGYGLRLLTIIQSPSQLRSTYGHDIAQTMERNHAARVVFRPETMIEAQEISTELGQVTVEQVSNTTQSLKFQKSTSTSLTKRQLLLAQEVKLLKDTQALIFVGGCPVIFADKIAYYKDKAFKFRYRDVIELPTVVVENQVSNDYDFSFINEQIILPDPDKVLNLDEINNFADAFCNQVLDLATE